MSGVKVKSDFIVLCDSKIFESVSEIIEFSKYAVMGDKPMQLPVYRE